MYSGQAQQRYSFRRPGGLADVESLEKQHAEDLAAAQKEAEETSKAEYAELKREIEKEAKDRRKQISEREKKLRKREEALKTEMNRLTGRKKVPLVESQT